MEGCPENETVIKEIVGALRRLVKAVYLDSSKISRQYGLTAAQSIVLRVLFHEGPLSSADLSRRLYVTPSNMTGVIDRLEKKALIERVRQAADRRVVLITLTQSGNALSRTLPDPIENKLISQLSDLKTEHVQSIAEALNRVLTLIDTTGLADAPLDLNPLSQDSHHLHKP
jgi:DNA-binding MarR family transcriptional regulator